MGEKKFLTRLRSEAPAQQARSGSATSQYFKPQTGGYARAERAKLCGYPERFAQEALGHNNKAVHRAYAKKAQMKIPSLEEYEQRVETKNQVTP